MKRGHLSRVCQNVRARMLAAAKRNQHAATKIVIPIGASARPFRHVTQKVYLIHMLPRHLSLIQFLPHEYRNDQDAGQQLTPSHPSIAGKACLSAREGLAPAKGVGAVKNPVLSVAAAVVIFRFKVIIPIGLRIICCG